MEIVVNKQVEINAIECIAEMSGHGCNPRDLCMDTYA